MSIHGKDPLVLLNLLQVSPAGQHGNLPDGKKKKKNHQPIQVVQSIGLQVCTTYTT